VLAAFSRGILPQDVFEQIAAHVPDCPSCQKALAQLGDGSDPLHAGLQQVQVRESNVPWPDTQPTQHNSPSWASTIQTPPGYELLGEVGRGGMGVIFRARDTRLNREVAIKLLREDCRADAAVCARFVAEAQITGQLQHPGIPAVHELGQLPDGRPFLAMKLVKGRTLHELLRERGDPSQERGRFLAIFEQVCQAVGYAHAHRVIHRDLKPGNVMVGAFGEVQLMDWGLAKLLAAEAPQQKENEGVLVETLLAVTAIETPRGADSATRTGSVMGTPAYMAPEQAGGEVRKLDARSDVFGLGAILCAILTGVPPYQGEDANAIRLQAVRGELSDTLARLDACGAEPDVVALCKRCLAFKQEDRPADGGAVAAEVASIRQAAEERARRAELERAEILVRAREERKRRRLALAAVVLLLAGVAVSTWLMMRARDAEGKAQMAADAERQANNLAQNRLRQIKKSQEVLAAIFRDLNPRGDEKKGPSLREQLAARLKMAGVQLESLTQDDPVALADLQSTLAESLLALGDVAQAIDLLTKVRTIREKHLGPKHLDTLTCKETLALAYIYAGQLDEAIRLYEQTLEKLKETLGPDDPQTLICMGSLADTYRAVNQLTKALPLLEESYEKMKVKLGRDHPHTLRSMNNLALGYLVGEKYDKAVPLYEEAVERMKATLGPNHPDTLLILHNLAQAYESAGQPDKALPLYEQSLTELKKSLGIGHRDTLIAMYSLSAAYRKAGKISKALPLSEQVLNEMKATLGPKNPTTIKGMHNLALTYQKAGQFTKALPLFEEALRMCQVTMKADHPDTLGVVNNLAIAYCEARQGERAVPLFAEYFSARRPQIKSNDAGFVGKLADAARNLLTCNQCQAAETYSRECLSIRTKTQPDAWNTFNTQSLLGGALLGQKKYAEAEPLLVKGYEGMKQREAKIPKAGKVRLTEAVTRLVQLYNAWGKPAEAEQWSKELAQRKNSASSPKK
jgi:serine/threonine protein kinase